MNEFLHFPTCQVWTTNEEAACNCRATTAEWVIRQDLRQQFPWRIFRCTGDGDELELMGCSTAGGAAALVESFEWLQRNGLRRRNNA